MRTIVVETERHRQVVDLTDRIQGLVDDEGCKECLCHLFVLHTTACLTTADLDPGTDLDMLDAFEAMIPKLRYRHPHDPSHVGDHILSSLVGPSLLVPVKDGALLLGEWQRIVLVEMTGPRPRSVVVSFVAS